MRLLLVADAIGESELEETPSWLAALAARLAARGHRVTALCASAPESWRGIGDPPGVIVWRPELETLERAFTSALSTPPDVVHLAATGPLPPRVAETLAALPLVLDAHDLSAVCPAGDLRRRPAMTACPHRHPHEACGACAGMRRVRTSELREPLVGAAAAALVHARTVMAGLTGALGCELTRVPMGVDPLRFRPDPEPTALAAELAAHPRPRALLLGAPVARPDGADSLDVLVSLAARVPDAELVIAGRDARDPDAHTRVLAEARRMGLAGSLRLLPRLDGAQLPSLFAGCDVAVALDGTPHAAGLALMRALASGLPVVAARDAGFEEWITDRGEGLLVEPRAAALADAAAALMTTPALREPYAERARLAAIERHDLERAVVAHEALYDRVRRDGRGARAA